MSLVSIILSTHKCSRSVLYTSPQWCPFFWNAARLWKVWTRKEVVISLIDVYMFIFFLQVGILCCFFYLDHLDRTAHVFPVSLLANPKKSFCTPLLHSTVIQWAPPFVWLSHDLHNASCAPWTGSMCPPSFSLFFLFFVFKKKCNWFSSVFCSRFHYRLSSW